MSETSKLAPFKFAASKLAQTILTPSIWAPSSWKCQVNARSSKPTWQCERSRRATLDNHWKTLLQWMRQFLKLPRATSKFKYAIWQKLSPGSKMQHCGNKCFRPRWESRPVDILVTGMLWVWRAFVIKGAYKSILLTAHQLLFAFHRRCIWDNSLPVGFYWPANGFLLCLNATWNQPIHELDNYLVGIVEPGTLLCNISLLSGRWNRWLI